MDYGIGNGQAHQWNLQLLIGALNCMHDQQAVLTVYHNADTCGDKTNALLAGNNDNHNVPSVCYGIDQQGGKGGANYTEDVAPTLASDSHGTPHGVCYGLDRASFNQGKNAQFDFSVEEELAQTLVSRGAGGVMTTQ